MGTPDETIQRRVNRLLLSGRPHQQEESPCNSPQRQHDTDESAHPAPGPASPQLAYTRDIDRPCSSPDSEKHLSKMPAKNKRREIAIMIDHYAAVRVWLDRSARRPRLLIEDLETGKQTFLDAVELALFTLNAEAVGPANRSRP